MTDLRRGGFGSPGFGPFNTNTGGFGQYAIGGTGEDSAYLDKLEAQIAWQNGRLSDAAYLASLRKYVKATEKGTSTYARAVDELADTEHSITRNAAVLKYNSATTPNARIAALQGLLAIDRSWLGKMRPGNEAYNEQVDRIRGLEADVREARFAKVTRRFNDGQMSNAEYLAAARAMAREARGGQDEQGYLDLARDFEGRVWNEKLGDAMDVWNKKQTSGNAATVRSIYQTMLGRVAADSPEGKQLAQGLESFNDAVKSQEDALKYEQMQSRHANGGVSDEDYLAFLRDRVKSEERGTVEYIRARDTYLTESFAITERDLTQAVIDGKRPVQDLIDFKVSALASMDLDSSRALQLQQEIANLRSTGLEALDIGQPQGMGGLSGAGLGGKLIGAPVGGASAGFVSQFDGSAFASENCGMAAAAMLAWGVTDGKIRATGGQMRYYSGDRDEGGTWVDDMVRAFGVLGIGAQDYQGIGFGAWRNKVKRGQPCVLTGTSGMLPDAYNVGTFQGAHSVYVDHLMQKKDGSVWYYVMDPLGRAGYKGQYWPEAVVQAFGWTGAVGSAGASAVFAGKSGSARGVSGKLPPFQAFDTDWLGQSTVGRGGGTSREEAGRHRDWSSGRPIAGEKERKGSDDEMVADFLAAIDHIEKMGPVSGTLAPGATPAALETERLKGGREKLAAEILERNGGDPRLAAVEWFSGQTPAADSSEWAQGDLWRANAVGRRMGYDRIRPGDNVQPQAPATPVEAGGPEPAYDPLSSAPTAPEEPTGLNPTLDKMSRAILRRLGIEPKAAQVRSLAAWIMAENGGQDVQGFNPLRLMTNGQTDLPGQIGKLDSGFANFGTYEAGMEAMADAIRTQAPGLVGALRSGDPETFVRALDTAGWSEDDSYAGAVTQAFNTLPGDTPVIAYVGPSIFKTPTDLGGAARRTPELEELFDVDPRDPAQLAWFQRNVESAYQAGLDGADTWEYELPDGTKMAVEATTGVVRDILGIDVAYTTAIAPPTPEGRAMKDEAQARYVGQLTQIDFAGAERYITDAMADRDMALLRQDWAMARHIELTMGTYINVLNGQAPLDTPDASAGTNKFLTETQNNKLARWIDALEPVTTNRFDPETGGGSFLAALERDGYINVEPIFGPAGGPSGSGLPTPTTLARVTMTDDIFITQEPDGRPSYHTARTDPDMFTAITEEQYDTGTSVTVPFYRSSQSPLVHVLAGGMDVYQPATDDPGGFAVFYQRAFEGADKQLAERQQSDPAGELIGLGMKVGMAITSPLGLIGQAGLAIKDAFGGQQTVSEPSGPATQPNPMNSKLEPIGVHDASSLPMYRMSYIDPDSGQTVTWLSLDKMSWIGYVGQPTGVNAAPGLVVTQGSGAKFQKDANGKVSLYVNGKPWDGKTDIGKYLHWYGTQAGDIAGAEPRTSMGRPGGDFLYRHSSLAGQAGTISGVVFDGTLTTVEKYRTGLMGRNEAMAALSYEHTLRESKEQVRYDPLSSLEANRAVGTNGLYPKVNQAGAPAGTPPWSPLAAPSLVKLQTSVSAQAVSAAQQRATATQALAREQQAAAIAAANAMPAGGVKEAMVKVVTPKPTVAPTPIPTPRLTPSPSPTPTQTQQQAAQENAAVQQRTVTYTPPRPVMDEEGRTALGGGR